MRLVLVNVPKPELIVREVVSLVKPGGWVASFEADLEARVIDPPAPEYARLRAVYEAHARSRGIDLHIGRRTHRLFRDAGLTDIHVDLAVHVHPVGHSRRAIFRDFVNNVRDGLIDGGFISRDDLERDLALFEEKLADDKVLITSVLHFLLRGRVPAGGEKLGARAKMTTMSPGFCNPAPGLLRRSLLAVGRRAQPTRPGSPQTPRIKRSARLCPRTVASVGLLAWRARPMPPISGWGSTRWAASMAARLVSHQPRRRLQPTPDRRTDPPLGRARWGRLHFLGQQPRHADECVAIRQYLSDNKVPQLFIASGAAMFSDPQHFPWTMGFIPNFRAEARIYARHIVATKPEAKIGVLYQNDSFGKDYLIGLKDGLGPDHAGKVIKEASYETYEPTVDSQIATLQGSGADVLLL